MTKETSTPDSVDTQAADTPDNITVFSDGSTFDYENGYQSNGAPVATRDRTENPTIVKSHKIFTAARVVGTSVLLILAFLTAGLLLTIVSAVQRSDNSQALKAGVNNSGQVEVIQTTSTNSIIVKRPDGGVFKCDVEVVSKDSVPTGLVFCSPGSPATFSIPLPHDPNNVFYSAPTEH